jgi:hypothetical protein
VIEATISGHEAVATIPVIASWTASEGPKPESRVEVRHDPIYKITEMPE